MRIVIDLQRAQTESCFRGIGRYSLSIAKEIAKNRGEHEIIMALLALFPHTIEEIKSEFQDLLPPENIRVWDGIAPTRECNDPYESRPKFALFRTHGSCCVSWRQEQRVTPLWPSPQALTTGFGSDERKAVLAVALRKKRWFSPLSFFHGPRPKAGKPFGLSRPFRSGRIATPNWTGPARRGQLALRKGGATWKANR